jgi:Zn-dependent metalloprotease
MSIMCSPSIRHSIFCIMPPYILRAIAQRGSPAQRIAATTTLALDSTLRSLRVSTTRASVAAGSAAPPPIPPGRRRTIYTANHQEQLPGVVVATEQAPPRRTADAAAYEAFQGLGATWDFYFDIYGRQSIDDEGMALDATIHYGTDYNNAFWNGQQMVFGDGDGQIFNRFTIALDVIGHELTHGVTQDEAALQYMFQPGALNESISDVFGSLIKQRAANQTAAKADWLIGAGLFTKSVNGKALRSMKASGTAYDDPVLGKDPQPDHMDRYNNTYQDNGGVHINSGIPNKAFYQTAVDMGGFAWEKAGRIWYETLRDSALRDNTGFKRFANLTVATAIRLYGAGSTESAVVANAWASVGLTTTAKAAAVPKKTTAPATKARAAAKKGRRAG